MCRHKFLVFKLKDLRIPFIMLLVAIAAFSFFMFTGGDDATPTFAPDSSYADGMYIASIAFTDADMDLVVQIKDKLITSIALESFDETERTLYSDLNNSVSFVNDYVTSTQSVELPDPSNVTASTSILMDAVKVALSEQKDATLTTTYEVPLLEAITEEVSQDMDEAKPEDALAEDVLSETIISDDMGETEEATPSDVDSMEEANQD
ncbi:MAG: hypothetical protein RR627_06940 [Niameybacter sp.]